MSEKISIREAARRLGVSDTAVHKAIKAGRVTVAGANPKNGRPELLWPEVERDWHANSDQMKRSHVGSQGSPRRAGEKSQVKLGTSGSAGQDAGVRKPASTRPAADEAEKGDDSDRGGGSSGPSYAQSRAIREAYQARLAKLEYEERAGKLVSIDAVKVEAFKVHRQVRDAMLNIPDRCAAQLSVINDPIEVHSFLLAEINAALRLLSADIYTPGTSNN